MRIFSIFSKRGAKLLILDLGTKQREGQAAKAPTPAPTWVWGWSCSHLLPLTLTCLITIYPLLCCLVSWSCCYSCYMTRLGPEIPCVCAPDWNGARPMSDGKVGWAEIAEEVSRGAMAVG